MEKTIQLQSVKMFYPKFYILFVKIFELCVSDWKILIFFISESNFELNFQYLNWLSGQSFWVLMLLEASNIAEEAFFRFGGYLVVSMG